MKLICADSYQCPLFVPSGAPCYIWCHPSEDFVTFWFLVLFICLFCLFLTFIYCHNSISAIYLYLFFKYYFIYICISNITLQNKGIIAVVLCQLFLRILQFLLFVLQQTIKLNVEYYSDYSVSVVMLTHFYCPKKTTAIYIYIYAVVHCFSYLNNLSIYWHIRPNSISAIYVPFEHCYLI